MKKIYIIIILVLLGLGGILFFIKNNQSNIKTPNNSRINSFNKTATNHLNKNTVTNNTSKNNTSNGRKDSGFDLEFLKNALENAGYITEQGKELDTANEFEAEKVVKYGNILLVQYGNDLKKYLEIYDEQKVNYQGRELKLGGAVGPYLLFFLDNNIDQKAVETFEQAGGYYR